MTEKSSTAQKAAKGSHQLIKLEVLLEYHMEEN